MAFVQLFVVVTLLKVVYSVEEHVSIVTSNEVPSATPEEMKRFVDEEDYFDNDFHLISARGKKGPRSKWGGSDYPRREQKAILEAHNTLRRDVNPPSQNMFELVSYLRNDSHNFTYIVKRGSVRVVSFAHD